MDFLERVVPHHYDGVISRQAERNVGAGLGLLGAVLWGARLVPLVFSGPLAAVGAVAFLHSLTRLATDSTEAHVLQSIDAGRVTATGASWINPDIERITADMPPDVRARLMNPNPIP